MKLNADIIFDNLCQFVMLESYGHKKKELNLKRPEFYNGESREFKANHIYITLVDRLPLDPVFGNGVVIICIGGNPPITYFVDKCISFILKDNTDIFTVFNLVQQIFDKYDEWDEGLKNIINTNASIKELVEFSFPVFENPIMVIDSNFHYLAYSSIIDTKDELADLRPDKNGNIRTDGLVEYLNNHRMYMTISEPFIMTVRNVQHFSFNLFEKNVYAGNLTIPFILQPQRQSDIVLAQYLAKVIESSFKKYSTILSSRANILKEILRDLLNCFPVDSTRMQYLEGSNYDGQYICIKTKFGNRSHKVPVEIICNIIENSFSGCVSFEYDSSIVTFIDIKAIPYDEKTLADLLKKLLKKMSLQAGVSYPFTNLSMARLYYRQASIALEMGYAVNPDLRYYPFHDYVLLHMMSQCMGEFPLELLLSKGIFLLLEHDIESQTNYIETLRTYLNNNMNITKTAEDLFIHRSTLLERLKRIESLLKIDLKDPDQRLLLLISLKIIETNEKINTKLNNIRLYTYNDKKSEEPGKLLVLENIYKENR